MEVKFISQTAKFVGNLELPDETRVYRVRDLFENYGFAAGPKYIKKVSGAIWELRAGKARLLLCVKGDIVVCVHAFFKKTQKLQVRDIKLAERRCREI